MSSDRVRRWAVPVGAGALAAAAALAVPALGGTGAEEHARPPTTASLARQVATLRRADATLRRQIARVRRERVVGVAGAAGPAGPAGATGPSGPPGPPGPFPDGPLPAGKTIRGHYAVGAAPTVSATEVPISFGFLMASEPRVVVVAPGQSPKPPECQGTVYLPQAAPGVLCVYRQFENGLGAPGVFRMASAEDPDGVVGIGPNSGRAGAFMEFGPVGAGPTRIARGSWAVTSP